MSAITTHPVPHSRVRRGARVAPTVCRRHDRVPHLRLVPGGKGPAVGRRARIGTGPAGIGEPAAVSLQTQRQLEAGRRSGLPATTPLTPARPMRRTQLEAALDGGTVSARQERAPRRAAEQVPLRITARGRRLVIAVGFAVAIALGAGFGAVVHQADAAPAAVDTVVVQAGQSLWVIAEDAAGPGEDVRDVVAQIRSLNGLDSSMVHVGQELAVPAG